LKVGGEDTERLEDDEEEFDEEDDDDEGSGSKKKDKKLVFLSRTVLEKVRSKPMTTGTQIANEILELYKNFCEVRFFISFPSLLIPFLIES